MDMETDQASSCVDSEKGVDAIKESFKYFKRRKPPPDFSHVVDFDQADHAGISFMSRENVVERYPLQSQDVVKDHVLFGLKHPSEWKAYTLHSHPGLIFIRNPFSAAGQRFWAARCLRDLPQRPHKTNLDSQGLLPAGQNWWQLCLNGSDKARLQKLRWVTLGFHHDWNSKVYNMCDRSKFPADLAALSALVALVAGFADFSAEAAIVNFYHADSTLAPHTDRSEWDMAAPLLSLSFGQPAVFLIGGLERSVRPAAMFVRSGDVVIMAGHSRLCYHAIPRLITTEYAPPRWQDGKRRLSESYDNRTESHAKLARHSHDSSARSDRSPADSSARSDRPPADSSAHGSRCAILCECDEKKQMRPAGDEAMDSGDATDVANDTAVLDYLRSSRINLNVRQVLPRGMMFSGAPG